MSMLITPAEFVSHWEASTDNEIQAYHRHFHQLCQIVGLDPDSREMTMGDTRIQFQPPVKKQSGKRGFADISRKGYFALEYKAKGKDLDLAYSQLQSYAPALNNPPVLIVTNFEQYRVYPQWPNTDQTPWTFSNADLLNEKYQEIIKDAIAAPERLKQRLEYEEANRTRITEQYAGKFADLAIELCDPRQHGNRRQDAIKVARFLTRLVFSMFAEDIGILHTDAGGHLIERIFYLAQVDPKSFKPLVTDLFRAMNGDIRYVLGHRVPYINGRLFGPESADDVIDLTHDLNARTMLYQIGKSDWKTVNPSIFGTVFERALDPSKRAQLGAHYTSEEDIWLIVEPVLMRPLYQAWEAITTETGSLWLELETSSSPRDEAKIKRRLTDLYNGFLDRLRTTTVLDPACGSGNFLYVSLRALKDLEYTVHDHFKPLGLDIRDTVTPLQLYGIEKNPFAAELARVVVWIGYFQWRYFRENGLEIERPGQPLTSRTLLEPVIPNDGTEHIINRDAIIRFEDTGKAYEPEWPATTVIVGNPPFLGDKKMRAELGSDYTDALRRLYKDRIPGGADLVTYWFEKSRAQIEVGRTHRAGLLATNSICDGLNRVVLERIKQTGDIFMAWSDRDWMLDGAALNVSIVGFDGGQENGRSLDGIEVDSINSDLSTGAAVDSAKPLSENTGIAFLGMMKSGPFEIAASTAKQMLAATNLSGRDNRDVVRQRLYGQEIVGRSQQSWIIDFGVDMPEATASEYELPFQYVLEHVRPIRQSNNRPRTRDRWWIFGESRPGLRRAISSLSRYIATPEVAKHRIFVWVEPVVVPDHTLHVIAREDDYCFGILHSYIHELWSLRVGATLEDRPRYTSSRTFNTFPFPWPIGTENMTDSHVQAIASAAQNLTNERNAWLNPPGFEHANALTDISPLKKLTLTNLYNAVSDYRTGRLFPKEIFPSGSEVFIPRLRDLHDQLDSAVLAAYGWSDLKDQLRTPAGDEELLRRLLAENLRRASINASKLTGKDNFSC